MRAIAPASDGSAYIGGDFTAVGHRSNNGTIVSTVTGYAQAGVALPNGRVHTVIQDGEGGWYVSGEFQKVDGVDQPYFVRINADGSLDTEWDPNADGDVTAMVLDGTTLYVGGGFSNIGGQARNRIAAISTVTGLATAWNPNADASVAALELDAVNDLLYVGGNFSTIGGETRATLAALSTATGLANGWNPGTDITVADLALNADGSLIYVGGNFSVAGGGGRANLAVINTTTGGAAPWAPDPDGTVKSMVLVEADSTLYIGGDFSTVDGQARQGLAAVSTATGSVTAWNPSTDSSVDALLLSGDGDTLYVAGGFTTLGTNAAPRVRFGSVDTTTGEATAWNPATNSGAGTDFAFAFGATESTIYLGGDFSFVGGVPRNRLARILADGTLDLNWSPGANATVSALVLSGTTLYAGGDFTVLGGQERGKIGAVSTVTAAATSFNPTANLAVRSLHLNGTTLYAGGEFTELGGETRNNIAAINTATGLVTAWNPTGNETVWAIQTSADAATVYIAGQFTSMGGETRNRLAAVSASTGLATAWDPNSDGTVRAMVRSGSNLFVAGRFYNIGGQARLHLAQIDGTTGLATAWETEGYIEGNPDSGDPEVPEEYIPEDPPFVYSLVIADGKIYVGGFIVWVGLSARTNAAAFNTTTGGLDDWNPSFGTDTFAMAAYSDTSPLFVGGLFTSVGTKSYSSATQFLPVGATVSAPSGAAAEGGATATYTVVLTSKPTASVTVTPTPDADVTVLPASVTFTTSNWATPQTFTVTAVDDTEREGGHTGTITHAATSADTLYDGVSVDSAAISITDNDRSGGGGGGVAPAPTTVTVLTPNGGETYMPGDLVTIGWASTGRAYLFNLSYSTDAGTTWHPIVFAQLITSNAFGWRVPDIQTDQALVRVRTTDLAITVAEDVSDATFRIGSAKPAEPDITLPIDRHRFLPPGTPVTGLSRSPVTGLLETVTPIAPGDFIRSPSFATVYRVTDAFGRKPFPDAMTFFTYADSFAQVREVTDATMTLLSLETPVFPKEGTVFVKITSAPETYVVERAADGTPVLRWITTETVAKGLAGDAWNAYIIDVPVTSFGKIAVGNPVTDASQVALDPTKLKRRVDLAGK